MLNSTAWNKKHELSFIGNEVGGFQCNAGLITYLRNRKRNVWN